MKKVDFCFTWRHTWPQRRSLMIICLSPKMNCRVEVASFCSSLPRVGTRTKKMIKTAEITVSCGYVFNVGIVEHQLETQHVGKDFRVRSSVCSIQLDYKWSIKSAKFRLVTILLCVLCAAFFLVTYKIRTQPRNRLQLFDHNYQLAGVRSRSVV